MENIRYFERSRPDVEYFIENAGEELGDTMKVLLKRLYQSEISIDEFDEKVKSRIGSTVMVLSSIDD